MSYEVYYPGYTRRAISFTMDDGRIDSDGQLISVLRPYGIIGTFNISHVDTLSPEDYRALYRGHEINNHVKYHPYVFSDGVKYDIVDEVLDPDVSDEAKVYRHPKYEGLYCIHRPAGWRNITTPERYIELTETAKREIEAVFGEGSVKGFAWPFGEQDSKAVKKHLVEAGYYGARRSSCIGDTTGFAVPEDRMSWSHNANHRNLIEMAEKFAAYPDDGELKCFIFGVHSIDYARYDEFKTLREFAERYGSRHGEFWYATVGEIFAYKDAVDALTERGGKIYNPSDIPVYITAYGKKYTVAPGDGVSLT